MQTRTGGIAPRPLAIFKSKQDKSLARSIDGQSPARLKPFVVVGLRTKSFQMGKHKAHLSRRLFYGFLGTIDQGKSQGGGTWPGGNGFGPESDSIGQFAFDFVSTRNGFPFELVKFHLFPIPNSLYMGVRQVPKLFAFATSHPKRLGKVQYRIASPFRGGEETELSLALGTNGPIPKAGAGMPTSWVGEYPGYGFRIG